MCVCVCGVWWVVGGWVGGRHTRGCHLMDRRRPALNLNNRCACRGRPAAAAHPDCVSKCAADVCRHRTKHHQPATRRPPCSAQMWLLPRGNGERPHQARWRATSASRWACGGSRMEPSATPASQRDCTRGHSGGARCEMWKADSEWQLEVASWTLAAGEGRGGCTFDANPALPAE